MSKGWIGVDLDGTLAKHTEKDFNPSVVGEPIPLMLNRVHAWLMAGKDVRIFTARVSSNGSNGDEFRAQQARRAIGDWCYAHFGRALPVTCCKDYEMIELWDDRAVQVDHNTGRRADGRAG